MEGACTMGNIRVEGKKIIYQRKDELTIIEPYGMELSSLQKHQKQ